MSYCPECGEKIANDDVFCPYCGISLKPVLPVDDASMSETIVGFQASDLADNLSVKGNENTPKIEPLETPSDMFEPSSETPSTNDGSENVSNADTSENWSMKTESVEIPAEQMVDVDDVPLPVLFQDEPEKLSENIDSSQSALDSTEKSAVINVSDAPTPHIIQEEESAVENPVLEPPVEEINSSNTVDESPQPIADNAFSSDWESDDDFGAAPSASLVESAAVNETEEKSDLPENMLSEPDFEVPRPPLDDWSFNSVESVNKSVDEVENNSSIDNQKEVGEILESPIPTPEMPLVLENQEEQARFDSVQIIQKNEFESEKAAPQEQENHSINENSSQTPVEAVENRSFTTPNMAKGDTDGRKAAKLKPLDEGTILNNRYEIVRKIGGGGMGAVYLANDRNLGGVLRAVKEMVQSYIESEQQDKAINDFKRESLLLTSLDHAAIPTIYDYFLDEKEGRFYLVMKYISGGDLASRLRAAPEGRIDEKSVTEWAIQIADVLDYLHNHEPSIVYRDLKPANVMIDGNSGRVMLIDFGIARWVNKEEKGVTAVGTMGYAPPELFSGNVEPRSDIYSLGSTMFHLLTGADPQSNPLLIFDFQKHPRPRQINSQLSDQIEQILMRAVEYNAEARFRSAAEMRDSLKEHYNNLLMGKVTYGVKVAPSNRAFSEQAVFCGFCGKQIVATDVFCAFCGAQQPIAQQNFSQPSVAVQPMTAKLVIMGTGELEPSSFRLEKNENLLGRRDPMSNIFPEVDLSKYDPQTKISRRHARIWREGNSFLVEDLGSSNGTTLLPSVSDSVRLLPHQPHTLTNGDKIKLGDTTLHFTIG